MEKFSLVPFSPASRVRHPLDPVFTLRQGRFGITICRFTVVCLFFLSCPALPARAETLIIDSETQYAFAVSCYKAGNFEQAATEFRRFIYFFPRDDRVAAATYHIGLSYFHLGRFQAAEEVFRKTLEHPPENDYYGRAYLMIGECRIKSKDITGAAAAFRRVTQTAADASVQDEAWYRLAWLSMDAGSWQSAGIALKHISPDGKQKYHTDKLIAEIDAVHELPQKNPTLAGALSTLPGSGHLYCERYQDATIAFLLNAALIGSAWEAFDQDLYWLGGAISLLEIGIYSGTIYSAVGCAHKYNRKTTETFINRLKRRFSPELSVGPAPGGFHLALQFDF